MNLIIVDGGNRDGAYASFVIFSETGEKIIGRSMFWGIGDNNEAEYLGLLNALDKALTIGLKDAIIMTDSETVVKQILFERPLHAAKLKRIRSLILERLELLDNWEICHVSRVLIKTFLGH